jgi:hypothetical protein
VVIGVHAPEFAFEKSIANVKAAVGRLGITYPVAPSTTATGRRIISSMRKAAFAIIISARGSMSARSASSNNCLREAGAADVAAGAVAINAAGVQAPSDMRQVLSPET